MRVTAIWRDIDVVEAIICFNHSNSPVINFSAINGLGPKIYMYRAYPSNAKNNFVMTITRAFPFEHKYARLLCVVVRVDVAIYLAKWASCTRIYTRRAHVTSHATGKMQPRARYCANIMYLAPRLEIAKPKPLQQTEFRV